MTDEAPFEELPTPRGHKRQFSTTVRGQLLDALLAAAQVDGLKPHEVVARIVQRGLRERMKQDDRVALYVHGVEDARRLRAEQEKALLEEQAEVQRRRKSFKVVDGGA